jgi:nucleoside-diphosphate-sugar epimerase
MVKILFTGAVGYIGSSALSAFLDHPKRDTFEITALIRSAEKADKLKQFGITTVVGSHLDEALFVKLASETDVLVACADSDHPDAATYALKGLKKRFDATGVPPIFIHTSGTGVLADNALGAFTGDVIWHDDDPVQIETIPDDALHRDIELMVIDADKQGYIKAYIISPSTIWGYPTHKVAKTGVTRRHSHQIPLLINASLARGNGGIINKGLNVWDNVNTDELGLLYAKVYDVAVQNPDIGHGREGIYFARGDDYMWKDLSKAVAQALYDIGKGHSPEPTEFPPEELEQRFGFVARWLGCNSRSTARRSLSTGWNPKLKTPDMLAYIKDEVNYILTEGDGRH